MKDMTRSLTQIEGHVPVEIFYQVDRDTILSLDEMIKLILFFG